MGNQILNTPYRSHVDYATLHGELRFDARFEDLWVAFRECRWQRRIISDDQRFWNPLMAAVSITVSVAIGMFMPVKNVWTILGVLALGLGTHFYFDHRKNVLQMRFQNVNIHVVNLRNVVAAFANQNRLFRHLNFNPQQLEQTVTDYEQIWNQYTLSQATHRIYGTQEVRTIATTAFDHYTQPGRDLATIMNDEP